MVCQRDLRRRSAVGEGRVGSARPYLLFGTRAGLPGWGEPDSFARARITKAEPPLVNMDNLH